MKVSVLGGGPSGMFAAWAAIQFGYQVTVYDRDPEKISVGKNHGVFALWDDCDLFLSQRRIVKCGIIGAKGLGKKQIEQKYALKVYGDPDQQVSVGKYINFEKFCYNHQEAYIQILDILGKDNVKKWEFDNLFNNYEYSKDHWREADIIFCTLPADKMFPSFNWPYKEAFIYHSKSPEDDFFMIYNVNEYIPWYRTSAMFGVFNQEFAVRPNNPAKQYVTVKKVQDSDISPKELIVNLPSFKGVDFHFTGRYGAWKKDMLTEDVYWDCVRFLSDRQIRTNISTTEIPAVKLA